MIEAFFRECSRQWSASIESFAAFTISLRHADRRLVDQVEAIIARDDLNLRDALWLVTGRLRQHADLPRRLH